MSEEQAYDLIDKIKKTYPNGKCFLYNIAINIYTIRYTNGIKIREIILNSHLKGPYREKFSDPASYFLYLTKYDNILGIIDNYSNVRIYGDIIVLNPLTKLVLVPTLEHAKKLFKENMALFKKTKLYCSPPLDFSKNEPTREKIMDFQECFYKNFKK